MALPDSQSSGKVVIVSLESAKIKVSGGLSGKTKGYSDA